MAEARGGQSEGEKLRCDIRKTHHTNLSFNWENWPDICICSSSPAILEHSTSPPQTWKYFMSQHSFREKLSPLSDLQYFVEKNLNVWDDEQAWWLVKVNVWMVVSLYLSLSRGHHPIIPSSLSQTGYCSALSLLPCLTQLASFLGWRSSGLGWESENWEDSLNPLMRPELSGRYPGCSEVN